MVEQISVRIDDELGDLIDAKQEDMPYDVSTSEIVRTALREHLSGNVGAAAVQTAD